MDIIQKYSELTNWNGISENPNLTMEIFVEIIEVSRTRMGMGLYC